MAIIGGLAVVLKKLKPFEHGMFLYIIYILSSLYFWILCITPSFTKRTVFLIILTTLVNSFFGWFSIATFFRKNLFKYHIVAIKIFCSINFIIGLGWLTKDTYDLMTNPTYQPLWYWVYGFTADIIGIIGGFYGAFIFKKNQ